MSKFRVTVNEPYDRIAVYEVETEGEGVGDNDLDLLYHPEVDQALYEGDIKDWVQVEEENYVPTGEELWATKIEKISDKPEKLRDPSTLDSLIGEVEVLTSYLSILDVGPAYVVGKIAATVQRLKKEKESEDASTP